MNAACSGWSSSPDAKPSIVVTSAPSAWTASTVQLFTASPFRWTVQAPQFVVSQPTCVPVSPSSSRSQWTRRRRASTSACRRSPLTVTSTWSVALIQTPSRSRSRLRRRSQCAGYCATAMVTKSFEFEGHRLVYDEYGKGDKVVVLLPGLLFSRKMHNPLAEELEQGGHRVLCLDLLGHGEFDRPPDMWNYGMTVFGRQTIALLDHAGVDQAVVGGTSLGANVTLEAAAVGPDRVRGMLIEMPVLDNALLACALAFTPLLVGLTFGAPVARAIGSAARAVPRVF